MIPLASIRLIISILTELRLIPKCKIIPVLDMTVLEDELVQLNNINMQQNVLLTGLQRDYDYIEKQYQTIVLLEQERKELIQNQATQINIYEKETEIANDELNALQDEITTATDLSKRLKEALIKWTS